MKKLVFYLVSVCIALSARAQTPDTMIFDAVESMPYPLLNMCHPERRPDWNADSARQCGEYNLQRLLAQNIRYPDAARDSNLQGNVVVSFVVEKDGRMNHRKILRDIGGGCGKEAMRVFALMDSLGLRWQPGTADGQAVRTRMAWPLRFRITEPSPWIVAESGDTIYTVLESQPQFKFGIDSLQRYIINRLEYPAKYRDSCRTGVIELSVIVSAKGEININNVLDFNALGFDYQFKAIQLTNRTAGQWIPATYQNKPVPATIPLRVLFKSPSPGCAVANERFDQAMILAAEGIVLSDEGKTSEALEKFNQALALQPDNSELLYYRGTLLLNTNQREGACADYTRIKDVMGTTWFESLRRVVCGW